MNTKLNFNAANIDDEMKKEFKKTRLNTIERMNQQGIYTGMMHRAKAKQFLFKNRECQKDESELSLFAGRSFLIGSMMNVPMFDIHRYVFNTSDALYYDELPQSVEDIKQDMMEYLDCKVMLI